MNFFTVKYCRASGESCVCGGGQWAEQQNCYRGGHGWETWVEEHPLWVLCQLRMLSQSTVGGGSRSSHV